MSINPETKDSGEWEDIDENDIDQKYCFHECICYVICRDAF